MGELQPPEHPPPHHPTSYATSVPALSGNFFAEYTIIKQYIYNISIEFVGLTSMPYFRQLNYFIVYVYC